MEFLNECPQVILTPQRLRVAWFLDELMDQHYRGWDDGFRWLLKREAGRAEREGTGLGQTGKPARRPRRAARPTECCPVGMLPSLFIFLGKVNIWNLTGRRRDISYF